ncbi:MAG: hypothetical protein M1822_004495 [Bathelium mastoideum]|nr:MAG: hypothetical protein M1822_004495 [Bathelium mastoideum]
MQRTYDDCYLICSTAVYFENQSNEAEALRSWRNALDQIYYHNAYRVPANYQPKTETERALQDSLRDMELQCKERVDLLEALRQSRSEAAEDRPNSTSTSAPPAPPPHQNANTAQSRETPGGLGLGQGSIPPMDYPQIAHPTPPLPHRPPPRPTYTTKKSSDAEIPMEKAKSSSFITPTPPPSGGMSNTGRKVSRTPSPEKRGGMLKTLRSGNRDNGKSSSKMPATLRSRPPAAAKAATQAWGSLPRMSGGPLKDSLAPSDATNGSSSSSTTWDPYTRRLVKKVSGEDMANKRSSGAASPVVGLQKEPMRSYEHLSKIGTPRASEDGAVNEALQRYSEQNEDDVRLGGAGAGKDVMATGSTEQPVDGSPNTSQRPAESQPQLPKLDAKFLSYRKEYPTVTVHPSQVALAEKRRPVQPSTEAEPTASPAEEPSTDRRSTPVQARKSYQGDSSPSVQRKPCAPKKAPLPPKPRASNKDGKMAKGKDKSQPSQRQNPTNDSSVSSSDPSENGSASSADENSDEDRAAKLLKNLPKGIDPHAAQQIIHDIVVQGDEVHWSDIAGLDAAKAALKETVVYPFLRPDLFLGLREPARGMLLFGPPGTGKTMLARAVATESRSTFFAISAASLTSKYLGESERLVRALFATARALAPSIIFVDEIDSLLSARGGGPGGGGGGGGGEHEATRRIKTEFLIQWSDLARAAAGREQTERERERGDASRVLVLAATNMPWAIDEAARRRFVRRQYIPLPEDHVRALQLRTLLSHQTHGLSEEELGRLVELTDGFSGSDMTALAKDAAMGPLRSLGEKLLHMSPEDIRPIQFEDFEASLVNIRPSVSRQGLKEYEQWAKEFGERGG